MPDPWAGFAGFVERICELQAGDRGLSDLLSMTLSADEQVEQLRRTANELLLTVIDRAKATGALREDFVGEDLVLLLIATSAVMHVTRTDAPGAWAAVRGPRPRCLPVRRLACAARAAFGRPDDPRHDPACSRTRLR